MSTNLRLDIGCQTHPGQVRQRNEDSFGLPPPNLSQETLAARGYLYLVADGMGGYQGGQQASQMAVQRIMQEYYQDTSPDLEHSLARAIRLANAQIYQEAQRSPELQKMGSTVTAAVVRGRELLVANVGDSRTYLVRNGLARQLTEDHSFIAQGLKQGIVTPDQVEKHPYRGVITRVLGGGPDVQPDFFREQLQAGDAILLCSDGLPNEVDDQQIAATISRSRTAQEAAGRLVNQANQHGGRDNVTAIVIGVDGRRPAAIAGLPSWLLPLAGAAMAVALILAVLVMAWRPTPGPLPAVSPLVTPGTTALATPPMPVAMVATTAAPPLMAPTAAPPLMATTTPSQTLSTGAIPTETETGTGIPASATPSPTTTPTRKPSPTATPTPTPVYPRPELVDPPPDATLSGKRTFKWKWTGEWTGNLGFELQISTKEDEDFVTVLSYEYCRKNDENTFEFPSVEIDTLPQPANKSGPFYWRVTLIDTQTKDTLVSSESRPFKPANPNPCDSCPCDKCSPRTGTRPHCCDMCCKNQ